MRLWPLLSLLALAPSARAADEHCAPLNTAAWDKSELLELHVATRCHLTLRWLGWSPPREYDYRPDADGWISDYFISGGYHGQVYWNLRTNAVVVRPREGHPLNLEGARVVAAWAKATNFPGLDLSKLDFSPGPVN